MRSDRYDRGSRFRDEPEKKKKRGPLRILLILILVLAAAIAGATAYFYYSASRSIALTFTEESPVVEFGEYRPSMDFVKECSGEIYPSSDALATDAVGSAQLFFTVEQPVLGGLLRPSKEFVLNYSVADSVPPLRIMSGDGTVIERGSDFDINSIISYGDNADPVPLVSVDGKVNTDQTGDYPLHVTVTDSSGNSTDWDLTVTVADELPVYEDDAERTAFADFVKANKKKDRSFGIDISAWQDEVDFKALKKAGCEFVIIRIGYTSEDDISVDKTFHRNLEGARAAGLKTGVYYYSTDSNEEQARYAADWIVSTLDGFTPDLPIAFDWEDFTNYQSYGISLYQLNRLYDAFADELSGSGYSCMLYGSKNYLENVWTGTDVRPVWLAHYTEKTDYEGPFMLWQASCTGRIPGINGDVDMDILYNNN